MEFDFSSIPEALRYKLMTAVVVPRPIAWVTTSSRDGVVNVAPFSFFNMLGGDPPIVALGIGDRPNGEPKDTRRNITETGEFVVNLVTFAAREAMNRTAAEFPPGESELEIVDLATRPSVRVQPPRLALSPVNLECVRREIVAIGDNRIVLGEVVHARIDDTFFDPATGYVATERLDLIGRMHGRGWYVRTTDLFDMPRVSPDQARRR